MYKGKVLTNIAVPANTPVPFELVYNTNRKTTPDQGVVSIHDYGLWDVEAHLNVTGVTGEVTAQIFINDEPEALTYENLEAATEITTLNITDQLRVIPSLIPQVVKVSVRLSVPATVQAGSFFLVGERK